MKFFKKKRKVVGIVVEKMNYYYVVEEKSGEEYKLYAIRPMEAVSPDFDIGKFAKFVGKEVIARGEIEQGAIWNAHLVEVGGEDEETELDELGGL
ncbi:MAG: hypothetical protein ACTSO7_13140 [Candidatus Heimdallarchaeota archaeon]